MSGYVYEVQIRLWDESHDFYVDHRFMGLPTTDVMVALRDEATTTFTALYASVPADLSVKCVYLDVVERQVDPTPRAVESV